MLIEKEVGGPGVWWYTDAESGLPRALNVTAELLKYWHDTGKEMLAAELSIPVPLEHQLNPDGSSLAKPLTKAEQGAQRLRDNAGWVKDYKFKGETLYSVCDITEPDVGKKIKNGSIKWTSPWIGSFMDGNGKNWDGVIGHLALTSRPRITKQQPFPSVSAAMSLAATLPKPAFDPKAPELKKGLVLSRAGLLLKGKPVYPLAFSLWTGVRLAAEDFPPKKKPEEKKPGEKPTEKPEGEKPAEGEKPPEGEKPGEGVQSIAQEAEALVDEGDISVCEVIADLLEVVDVLMPPGTDENFHERLYEAVMNKIKAMKPEKEGNQPPNGSKPNDLPPNPIVQEQQPMYMALSIDEINKIADPDRKRMAEALFSMQGTLAALKNNALEDAKVKRQRRLDRLAKALSKEQVALLLAESADARFSLDEKTGVVVDEMDRRLTLMEGLKVSVPALLKNGVHLSADADEERQPSDMTGGISPEKIKEARASLAAAAGVPAK